MRKWRVLVVDDRSSIVDVLRIHFTMRGFEVLTAYSGTEALEKAMAERPDVVVLDLILPGLTGTEVLRAIKENPETAPIPVIIMTARAEVAGESYAEVEGAAGFLVKPFDLDQLEGAVERALSQAVGQVAAGSD